MELHFNKILRNPTQWIRAESIPIKTKGDLLHVIEAKYPVGKLPTSIISQTDIETILKILPIIECKKYENTREEENVQVWGNPFVDSATINEHLSHCQDILFETILANPFSKLVSYFESFGITVAPLRDSVTGICYGSKVIRKINIPAGCKTDQGNDCNVYHFDDILRDGMIKSDFRLPNGLSINNFHQFSVCIPLENGYYPVDNLEVFEYRYFPQTKDALLDWRVEDDLVRDVRRYSHSPIVGEPYMFNSQNVHNVNGGHPLSNRINFSVFFIYVPEINTLFYYN